MPVRFVGKSGSSRDTGICERNLNLLAHAQSIELDIGSLCGGHGICGGDRVRIRPGSVKLCSPVTREEREHLTEDELASGWRLACQCFPEKDGLELDVEVGASASFEAS